MIKKGRKESICNVIGRMITVTLFVMVLSFMPKDDVYATVTESTIGDYSYSLDDSTLTASVIGYVGTGGDISIPDTVTDGVNTYSVTSIGNRAFESCSSLISVTIPDSVTSIGEYAFFRCGNLTDVTIPNSVTSMGNRVFESCRSLTDVTLPDGVTSIGVSTFFSCSSLTSVTIPNSVTWIGDTAFSGCSSLTNVTFPDSVRSMGIYAFNGCSSLTSVTLSNSMTKIATGAFNGCSSLTDITIPNSVTSIENNAFAYCSGLEIVYYPAELDISNSKVADYGATVISYTIGADNTASLMVENIQSGITDLTFPATINGKNISLIQCAEGVDKLDTTPDIPEQTIDTLCSAGVVSDISLADNWLWKDEDKGIALTVGTPVIATAVYSGMDKAIYSNTEVEVTIITTHTGEETIKDAKLPTCGENGYTGDTWCAVCDAKISDGSVVPKMDNHTYDNGVVTKAATVTETGVKTYTCTVCKTTKTETIEKLPAPLEEELEEVPQPEEETEVTEEETEEETPEVNEESDNLSETNKEEITPIIQPDTIDKETGDGSSSEAEEQGFNILFVIIPVILLLVVGGGVWVFFKKKKK